MKQRLGNKTLYSVYLLLGLRIVYLMMLSVLRNARRPVLEWLMKNELKKISKIVI